MELVSALRRHGFGTNTSRAHPLTALLEGPTPTIKALNSGVSLSIRDASADRAHRVSDDKKRITDEEVVWLGEARHLFPRQFPAYENLKIILRCQCSLIRQSLELDESPISK